MAAWDEAPGWLKGWSVLGVAVLLVWWYLYMFLVWPNALVSALLIAVAITPLTALASLARQIHHT